VVGPRGRMDDPWMELWMDGPTASVTNIQAVWPERSTLSMCGLARKAATSAVSTMSCSPSPSLAPSSGPARAARSPQSQTSPSGTAGPSTGTGSSSTRIPGLARASSNAASARDTGESWKTSRGGGRVAYSSFYTCSTTLVPASWRQREAARAAWTSWWRERRQSPSATHTRPELKARSTGCSSRGVGSPSPAPRLDSCQE
jgi:hypothetical protein